MRLAAKCTTLKVYENRTAQTGRQIEISIAVVPATSRTPLPDPLFFLAGGPGEAATEAYAAISGAFSYINLKRDIVLVDQRGTGKSHPLTCDEETGEITEPAAALQNCLKTIDADPRFYTTSIAMDDLDDVRAALGYEKINLYGASYGTRAALVYARQYPDHLRAMILDGVAPLGWLLGPNGSADAQRAINLIFDRCLESTQCAEAFPDIESDFEALMTSLADSPVSVNIQDPSSGEPVTTTLTAEGVALTLHTLTYEPETAALIPLLIAQGSAGNLSPLAAFSLQRSNLLSSAINSGMYLSVVCSEDEPFFPENIQNEGFLGNAATIQLQEVCALWPRGEVPPDFLEPVKSDVPTLLLSGEADPVTPPENGDTALKTLPNGRHLVLPGLGHISILRGCVPILAREFIEAGSAKELDVSCIERLSPLEFFVNFNGPIP